MVSLQWCHNEHNGVSNHQRLDCLLNRLFRRRSKKTSKLRATGLCEGSSPATGELQAQRASNAENVSIWWRHHVHFEMHSNECTNDRYIRHRWVNTFPIILLYLPVLPLDTFFGGCTQVYIYSAQYPRYLVQWDVIMFVINSPYR